MPISLNRRVALPLALLLLVVSGSQVGVFADSPSVERRNEDFYASAKPNEIVSREHIARDATFTKKSVRWRVPKGQPLKITVAFNADKANSVFLAIKEGKGYIQIYKGRTTGGASQREFTHYADPLPYDQEYVLTTASKDTKGDEAKQPWYNNHPLGPPKVDKFRIKTTWETDDSRNPGVGANVRVEWSHEPSFCPIFEYIK